MTKVERTTTLHLRLEDQTFFSNGLPLYNEEINKVALCGETDDFMSFLFLESLRQKNPCMYCVGSIIMIEPT